MQHFKVSIKMCTLLIMEHFLTDILIHVYRLLVQDKKILEFKYETFSYYGKKPVS
jgi:hypothetical protein